jgi:CyaY protein
MSDSEFLDLVDETLLQIENALESENVEVEPSRSGNVLALEFENGSKIIINSQVALHEIWVAARAGGFHFRRDGSLWRDTRAGTEFFAALSNFVGEQSGTPVALKP